MANEEFFHISDETAVDLDTWARFDGVKGNEVFQRNQARRMKVWHITRWMYDHVPWMRPPVMRYIYGFWATLFEEGFKETLTPRWGAITFGWLNDGFKPTVWHTVWGLTHGQDHPWTAIYTDGAPRSRKEAEQRDHEYELKRLEAVVIHASHNMEDY